MPRIYRHTVTVPDTAVDAHGHVNNQEYLRWMQDAAVAHSAAQGWPMERYFAEGESWYVRSHFIEYERPAFAGDGLCVFTWVAGLSTRSSPRRYLFVRAADRAILARAETVWIYIALRTGRSIPIPDRMRQAFDVVEREEEVLGLLERGALTCEDTPA